MTGEPGATPLRAVLIDLDDTLLDNRSGVQPTWQVVAAFVRESHPDLPVDALLDAFAQAAGWYWGDPQRHAQGRVDLEAARRRIISRALSALGRPDAAVSKAAARRHTEYRETTYRLEHGALAALARLRRGVEKLALVTNGAAFPQRSKIERFGLARFFDHVQIEGEFGAGKPDRRVFEHVLARLGARPEESLMVGDDYRLDVEGALAAGLRAAWIAVEAAAPPPHTAGRQIAVQSFAELVDRLGY